MTDLAQNFLGVAPDRMSENGKRYTADKWWRCTCVWDSGGVCRGWCVCVGDTGGVCRGWWRCVEDGGGVYGIGEGV